LERRHARQVALTRRLHEESLRRLPLRHNTFDGRSFDDRSFDGGTLRRQQLRRRPPPRAIHPVNRAATTAASLSTTT
uniref:Uncharacterized protein n=1 Tax=Cucumis melo TaxID=3656 RepID=A0A9I9E321_CUCME